MEKIKGKRLILHYDGKKVKELEEYSHITVSKERIAISVSSPDLDETNDILLAIVESESSKGIDQADVILQTLNFFEITSDQIIGVCCDTTASNTGRENGANVIIGAMLDKPLLWFMCRRHMIEVHISHFMLTLTGKKTKAPRRDIYVKLKNSWEKIAPDLQNFDRLVRFDWNTLQPGSELHRITLEALEYGKRALVLKCFGDRSDYQKLCELFVFYLGGEVEGFKFHQPGACHEARYNLSSIIFVKTLNHLLFMIKN